MLNYLFNIVLKMLRECRVNLITILVFFLFLMYVNKTYGNEKKDSVVKRFPDVLVTSSRINKSPGSEFSAYSYLNKSELDKLGAIQLSDALKYIPGAFIKNFGGMGGFKTLSLRGTTAQQTVIMLDGMRINSSQNGITDLSIIPMDLINALEVVRGGNSAMFGANAIGGIVNLISRNYDTSGFFNGKFTYGSYEDLTGGIQGRIITLDAVIDAYIDYNKSKGDYPFYAVEYGETKTLHRDNADFENEVFSLGLNSKPGSLNFSLRAIGRFSDRGSPGAVIQNNVENAYARLNEKELFTTSSLTWLKSENDYFSVNALFRINDYHYNDPLAIGYDRNGIDEIFTGRDVLVNLKYSYNKEKFNSDLCVEGDFSDLRGNMLQPGVGNYKTRGTISLSGWAKHALNIFDESDFSYQLGLRLEDLSDAGSALSPVIGVLYDLRPESIKIKLNYAYNFRAPSFNEMYYLNYGTANLKPERSHSFNLGISYEPFPNTSIETEGFIISTTNQIISVPKSPLQWSAQNYGKVKTTGFELRILSSLLHKLINIQLSYTLQNAKDDSPGSVTYQLQIPYVPQELISYEVDFQYIGFTFGTDAFYSSYYYYLPDNADNFVMPSYNTVNIFVSKDVKFFKSNIDFRIDFNNVFNEQYCVVKNYPMPGRLIRGGFSIKF
jgi:vitamin B12 transporter